MPQGEKPRSEPEIIPPNRAGPTRSKPRARVFTDTRGTERVYVARIGPLAIILGILTAGVLAAVMVALLLGALLIWVPLFILFVAVFVISGLLRSYFLRAP